MLTETYLDAVQTENNSNGHCVRLNLGSGGNSIPGFIDVDRELGSEVFPLAYDDESVDEILASHILEHFSHRDTQKVLLNWIDKLKPGGRIRISVPDFEKLVTLYQAGNPVDLQGYIMGGHKDQNDLHGCLFDREALHEIMAVCGLERIGPFDGNDYQCTTRREISLNLQGFKPHNKTRVLANVRAVMSAPRFGPTLHFACHAKAFQALRIGVKISQSCYWAQRISEEMERALTTGCQYVLTLDFDTVFSAEDVLELYRLMQAFPDADAIFPLQSKRCCEQALFSVTNSDGSMKAAISEADLQRQLLPAHTGHFGLTLFRASSLAKFQRPWMFPLANEQGTWGAGSVDPDIVFWQRWKEQGFKAYLAPRVAVGHIEEIVKWPGKLLKPVYQTQEDYEENGIPAEVER